MALSQTKTKPKIDHIKARFGGRDLVFKIPRDHLAGFEAGIGEPAAIRFRRLVAGGASFQDVRKVLEYAAPAGLGRPIPQNDMDVMREQLFNSAHPATFAPISDQASFVAKTLAANPPAKYALLAQVVIAACLYGVPEDAGGFDEDEVEQEIDSNAES